MKPRLLLLLALLVAVPAFAQGDEPPPVDLVTSGLMAIGMALQAGGVWFLVQLVKAKAPALRQSAPQWIPVLALVLAPALDFLASALSGVLLHPIDLTPVVQAFNSVLDGFNPLTGALVAASDQFFRQRAKTKR